MITNFDRPTCNAVRTEILAALAPILAKHGLAVEPVAGSYSDYIYNLKLALKVSGKADGVEKQRFSSAQFLHGIPGEYFGKTFTSQGQTYRIDGYNSRARRMPIKATQVSSGKPYKFSAEGVRRALGLTQKGAA